MSKMISVMLIGLGPHARHHYFPIFQLLEQHSIARLTCVVDVCSQAESISEFLAQNKRLDLNTIYIDDCHRDAKRVSDDVSKRLAKVVQEYNINKVVIATEPKAHEAYVYWAISQSLDYLVDKPLLISTYHDVALKGYSDLYKRYQKIKADSHMAGISPSLMALRRTHPSITFVRNYLENFVVKYQTPITHINIQHGEGMWNMPNEYNTRENHPYKYGYGGLFHTGYHFVDLMIWILEINKAIKMWNYNSAEIAVSFTRPKDINKMLGDTAYQKLLNYDLSKSDFCEEFQYGEVDWQAIINFLQNGKVIASGNLDILQTNYSARDNIELPADLYKGNGRTYHEVISIEVGYLLNIRIIRMTSGSQRNKALQQNPYESFHVLIYRNSNLVGGVPFEEQIFSYNSNVVINGEEVFMTLGDVARYYTICDWLTGDAKVSELSSHERSQRLFAEIHELLASSHNKGRTMASTQVDL